MNEYVVGITEADCKGQHWMICSSNGESELHKRQFGQESIHHESDQIIVKTILLLIYNAQQIDYLLYHFIQRMDFITKVIIWT